MKKITCIQQYVIDNLIEDEILSTNSLLGAVSKVCSEEQFNNILSILLKHLFLVQTYLNWSVRKTQEIKQT